MRCSYILVWFPLQELFIRGACGGLNAWTSLKSSGGVVALRTVTYVSLSLPVKYKQLPELSVQLEGVLEKCVNISFQSISLKTRD